MYKHMMRRLFQTDITLPYVPAQRHAGPGEKRGDLRSPAHRRGAGWGPGSQPSGVRLPPGPAGRPERAPETGGRRRRTAIHPASPADRRLPGDAAKRGEHLCPLILISPGDPPPDALHDGGERQAAGRWILLRQDGAGGDRQCSRRPGEQPVPLHKGKAAPLTGTVATPPRRASSGPGARGQPDNGR